MAWSVQKSLAVSYKVKYTLAVGILAKRNENMSKDLYVNAESSFIHNSWELETAQMSVSRRLGK